MTYIENLSDKQKEVIVDKILSFIDNTKPHTIDKKCVIFYYEDNKYSIYRNIFNNKELSNVILSNKKNDIKLLFNLKGIDTKKLKHIEGKIMPLFNSINLNISDNELSDIFGIVSDPSIERSKKINKINTKIEESFVKGIINKIKKIY